VYVKAIGSPKRQQWIHLTVGDKNLHALFQVHNRIDVAGFGPSQREQASDMHWVFSVQLSTTHLRPSAGEKIGKRTSTAVNNALWRLGPIPCSRKISFMS
jgi:hypothetical protein